MTDCFYFGYKNNGHFLYAPDMTPVYEHPEIPWNIGLMDAGLLINGKIPDVYDGRVFWTCGGNPLWFAFFWWDRSGDKRPNSNSSLYVKGFNITDKQKAFEYACAQFPSIMERQEHSLLLQ